MASPDSSTPDSSNLGDVEMMVGIEEEEEGEGGVNSAVISSSSSSNSNSSSSSSNNKKGKVCLVCGDKALGYNFSAVSCESCKAFFRRNAHKTIRGRCEGKCQVTVESRSFCKRCRLAKCFSAGMRKDMILNEEEKVVRKRKILFNKMKRQGQLSSEEEIFISPTTTLPKHPVPLTTTLTSKSPKDGQEVTSTPSPSRSCKSPGSVGCSPPPSWGDCQEAKAQLTEHQRELVSELQYAMQASSFLGVTSTAMPALPSTPTEFINLAEGFVRKVIKVAKNIASFKTLQKDDQICLLKGSVVDIMMLRSLINYDPHTESWSLSTKDCLSKQAAAAGSTSSKASSPTAAGVPAPWAAVPPSSTDAASSGCSPAGSACPSSGVVSGSGGVPGVSSSGGVPGTNWGSPSPPGVGHAGYGQDMCNPGGVTSAVTDSCSGRGTLSSSSGSSSIGGGGGGGGGMERIDGNSLQTVPASRLPFTEVGNPVGWAQHPKPYPPEFTASTSSSSCSSSSSPHKLPHSPELQSMQSPPSSGSLFNPSASTLQMSSQTGPSSSSSSSSSSFSSSFSSSSSTSTSSSTSSSSWAPSPGGAGPDPPGSASSSEASASSRISAELLKRGSPEMVKLFMNYSKFVRSLMSSIQGDVLVLEVLIVMSLFSADRTTLLERDKVQSLQEEYASILQSYTKIRFAEDKSLFARLVMKLTDLRDINEVHSKMLLAMKVSDFEPLLLEIFDL